LCIYQKKKKKFVIFKAHILILWKMIIYFSLKRL
jgi:hypothetical protein